MSQTIGQAPGPDAVVVDGWWRSAVVYQLYIRSYADGDGDGIGDIAGLRARLDHLAALGVDALWVNPWYPSPQADAGYDVADFRDIEPVYGTLEAADGLVRDAHAAGLKVLLDIVPNHTSSEHAWFRAALAGDASARARYLFRPGRGEHGELPPNDWESNFGGPAWTRTTDPVGAPGDWYLHLFAPEQPDLDWENAEVQGEFEDILRFWFDRGVDGFRIDVAHGLAKAPGLPDVGPGWKNTTDDLHPAFDQDAVHDIYRAWRKVGDSYDPPRIFVAESWPPNAERLSLYVRPDELHQAFQFDLLRAPFDADLMRTVIEASLRATEDVGSVCTWVLSNHDVVREVTRYARSQPPALVDGHWDRKRWHEEPADLELGLRRARAAALLMLALPGGVYLYQGEELGLPEVEDLPDDRRQDPIFARSGDGDPGRDGCRVPLPWDGSGATYSFGPEGGAAPWLPQPADWAPLSVAAQEADPTSTLRLYRDALRLRRAHLVDAGPLVWLDTPPGVLAFRRGTLTCWLNTSDQPAALPGGRLLLGSVPGQDDRSLPVDAAAWVDTS